MDNRGESLACITGVLNTHTRPHEVNDTLYTSI